MIARPKQTEDKGKCICRSCDMKFRRLSGFRAHLVGPIGNRLHLSPAQMLEQGFHQDTHGYWRAASDPNYIWPKARKVAP